MSHTICLHLDSSLALSHALPVWNKAIKDHRGDVGLAIRINNKWEDGKVRCPRVCVCVRVRALKRPESSITTSNEWAELFLQSLPS